MPLLELKALRKSYLSPEGTRCEVLDVPEFQLEEGQECALEGSSGSGKTTLLHLIAGLILPDQGQVLLEGEDLCTLSEARRDRRRAEKIGYVFQAFHLLPSLSAEENVLLGMLRPDPERARQLLARVGLEHRLRHRPQQLSIGQRQRVAVARSLVNRPRLLLADEPTGNLDRRSADEVMVLLREVCAEFGAALLLVSHDRQMIDRFARVVPLRDINRVAS